MNAEHLMELDTLARQKIVENTSSNFFVEAGAGSGKTTILVERMVAMVEQGCQVSKICAITFTKAAAKEFYSRFQKRLIERSTEPTQADYKPVPGRLGNPTDETRSRCLDALNEIDLCFMGTIDAFCNMILSEHPARAKIPSNASIISDEDMLPHYKKAFSQIQNGLYGKDLQQLCRRFCGFFSSGETVFCQALPTLMQTRDCDYNFDAPADTNPDSLLQSEKDLLLPVLRVLLAHPELKYEDTATSRAAWDTLQQKQKLLFSPWQDSAHNVMSVLSSLTALRLIPETDMSLFGPAGAQVFSYHTGKKSWYEWAEDGLPQLCKRLQELRYAVAMEFLTQAARQIAKRLRTEGLLSFYDYILYLRDTLREDAASGGTLIRHIYERHKYYLIDEFQDTDPMQAQIFFYLTAQTLQRDWRKCIPHPGSLFIVGDPKQSIYRFKNADVEAFLQIRKLFTAPVGEVVKLTRNFRSTHKMRTWFNSTFSALLPDTTPLQSRFEPIPLEAAPVPDGTFEGVYSYSAATHAKAAPEDQNPAVVAKIIGQIVNNDACKILGRDDKTPRKVRYQDIMLIVPGKKKISDYTQALSGLGIPFRVEGKVLFHQCPSLVAVSRIFSAVANANSLQHLIGALTCDRFGFDMNALHRLKKAGYDFRLYADHPNTEPVSAAVQELKKLVVQGRTLSASALFTVILEQLQIFKYVSTKNMEYVYFVLELLRSAENSGQFASLSQAADYLEKLIADDTSAERAISLTQNENRVHIANLHKVKGLEAPIVILANPRKKSPSPSIRVEQGDPRPKCWLFSVSQNNITLFSSPGYQAEKDLEKACLEAEELRLLYVAATRAERVLLVVDAKDAKGNSSDSNFWKFFAERCEGDIFDILPKGTSDPVPKKKELQAAELYDSAENLLPDPNAGQPSYAIVRPSEIKLKGKTSSEDDFEDVEAADARTQTVRANAAVTGTLVHSLMEMLVSSRNIAPLKDLVREITWEFGAEGEAYRQLLTRVGNTVQSGGFPQKSAAPQDILATLLSADEVYCEVPFCRRAGTDIWHGIMDVVYRIGEQWFILDYKTNADDSNLQAQYQGQLDAYVEAFRDLTGHTATALIYHIDV